MNANLEAEVTNISQHGFWIFLDQRELFLPFEDLPWFRSAPVAEILDVQRPRATHLRWPALDVDLSLEAIEHPDRFPLISQSG